MYREVESGVNMKTAAEIKVLMYMWISLYKSLIMAKGVICAYLEKMTASLIWV